MPKNGSCVMISFTAKSLIATNTEIVIKAGFLCARALNEIGNKSFESILFTGLNLEIGMNADCL